MTSLAAQVSMLYNLGAWMPRGDISGRHLPQETLSDRIDKFSLFSLRAALQFDLQCVVLSSPQRTTSVFTLYSPISKSVVGVLNINS